MGSIETDGVSHDAGVAEARERVEINRELEQSDQKDAALAEKALQQEFGTADFETGRRMLTQYLASLPPAERGRIERATTKEGARALHDPTTLKALARRALGPMPTSREAANAEIAAARKRMRTDAKGWFADDRAQLRYRALLRALGDSTSEGE